MKHIGVMLRIQPDIRNWVVEVAKKDDRSMNWMINAILKKEMEQNDGAKENAPVAGHN